MKREVNNLSRKVIFITLSLLFFGTISVIAGNVYVDDDGIQSSFVSTAGNAGITQNVSYDDGQMILVIENGIIVGVHNASNQTQNTTFPTTNLISYYELEETSGAVVDSHGIHNGTNDGSTRGVSGKLGTSYSFDGNNDYIYVNDSENWDFTTSSFTIAFWGIRDNLSAGRTYISRDTESLYSPYLIGYSNGGSSLYVYMTSAGTSWDIASGKTIDPSVTIGSWTHYVITRNGNNFTTYKNATAVDSWLSSGSIYANTNALSFGHSQENGGTGYYIDGKMDEIGIWSRALSSFEISELYNDGDGLSYD